VSIDTTIEQCLQAFLAGRPEVSALVSTRVYPVKLPERPTYPAISFFRVNPVPLNTLDSNSPQKVQGTTVQISAWSTDYYEAHKAAETVRRVLQSFAGTMTDLEVGQVTHDGGRDSYDDEAQEPGVHQVSNDYTIWWKST
jgi:hypothetical protein